MTLDPVDSLFYGPSGFANGQIRVAFIRGNEYLDTRENTQISGNRLTGGIVITVGEQFRDAWLKVSSEFREFQGFFQHIDNFFVYHFSKQRFRKIIWATAFTNTR